MNAPTFRPPSARWRRYLRFWRANPKADVDDEIAFHLRERIDALVERGLSPAAGSSRHSSTGSVHIARAISRRR